MTAHATPLAVEEHPAARGLFRDGLRVARQEAVEGGIEEHQGALEGGDGPPQVLVVRGTSIGKGEHLLVRGILGDRRERRLLVRLRHLDRVEDGQFRLCLEARGATVEKQALHQKGVHRGRGVALAQGIADTFRHRALVGKAAADIMAGRAGHRAVFGQAGIEVQLLAECHPFRLHGVVGWDHDLSPDVRIDTGRGLGHVMLGKQAIEEYRLRTHIEGAVGSTRPVGPPYTASQAPNSGSTTVSIRKAVGFPILRYCIADPPQADSHSR